MSKLLSANIRRLFKSRLFILVTLGVFLFSAYVMSSTIIADKKYDLASVLEYRYYDTLPYAGLILSAFISLFIGMELSDGTIRNKITVGHTRIEIYFANLITCSVAATAFFAAWALGGLVGVPYFGTWSTGITSNLITLAVSYFSMLALTAIFNILAHLFQSRAGGAVAAIFLSIFIIYAGSYFYGSLNEPETTYDYVRMSDQGVEYGNEIPNPAYVSGTKRIVYETMSSVVPSGQQIRIADNYGEIEQPVFMIACSLGVTVIAAIAGYLLFRRKDIR